MILRRGDSRIARLPHPRFPRKGGYHPPAEGEAPPPLSFDNTAIPHPENKKGSTPVGMPLSDCRTEIGAVAFAYVQLFLAVFKDAISILFISSAKDSRLLKSYSINDVLFSNVSQ